MSIRKLVVVGVGLIGGSCALALKRAGAVGEVVGVGVNADVFSASKMRESTNRRYIDDFDFVTKSLAESDFSVVRAA